MRKTDKILLATEYQTLVKLNGVLLCGWFNGCNFYTKIEAIETEKKK